MKTKRSKKYVKRSKLQDLNSKTQWLKNFILHPVPSYSYCGLNLSHRSMNLIRVHNQTIAMLKQSIQYDYDTSKAVILKIKADFDRAALRDK